jgi:transposase
VGPNPTDRGKQGTKHHLIVDGKGTPLAAVLSGANRNDCKLLEAAVDAIPPVHNGKPGRPRCRPEKLHADKGYDYEFCRQALRRRGITPRIARKGIESSERLGRHRWRVEATLSWLHRNRRLRIRYEQRDDIHQAFLSLGCALICFKQLQRFC